MNQGYGRVPQGSINSSEGELSEGVAYPQPQPPQQFYMPQNIQPVNILSGPGYKVFEAQSQVSKWSWYINIAGWVFIILGGLKAFGGL